MKRFSHNLENLQTITKRRNEYPCACFSKVSFNVGQDIVLVPKLNHVLDFIFVKKVHETLETSQGLNVILTLTYGYYANNNYLYGNKRFFSWFKVSN